MGVLSRTVVRVALGRQAGTKAGAGREASQDDEVMGDWNIVQNNGARAAQVVPHVHFHIIPRPGDVPQIENRSWTIFGRGQREDLDEEDAEILIRKMREQLNLEIERVRKVEGEQALGLLIGSQREGREEARREKL